MTDTVKSTTTDHRWRKAVVTGASSGIGEAFVEQLVSAGVDVIAVGRDPERTKGVAERLSAVGSVEPLVADLTTDEGVRSVQNLFTAESDTPIDLLVNCAGFGVTAPFLDASEERQADILKVNVLALMRLSHTAASHLPPGGAILNISSSGGLRHVPGSAVYAASKSFVNNFSLAIAEEFRGRDISVVCVLPGYTETRFMATAREGSSIDWPAPTNSQTADEVVRVALDALRESDPNLVLTSLKNGEWARNSLAAATARLSVRSPNTTSRSAG